MSVSSGTTGTDGKGGAYSLRYSLQMGETEKNTLTIDEDGNVTGNVENSQAGSTPRPLGWFNLDAGRADKDVARIGALIRAKGLVGGRVHSRIAKFGMRSKIFLFEADGQRAVHHLDVREPTPEGLAEVEEVVVRLFRRLEEQPLRTLSLWVSLKPATVVPGGDLRIEMEFRNGGKFPTQLRNPASFPRGGANTIRINLWKRVKGEAGAMEDEYVAALDLAGEEFLVGERKSLPSDRPVVEVEPQGTLRAWTTIRLPKIHPGRYFAETVYYGSAIDDEENEMWPYLCVGEYHADPCEVVVSAK